MNKETLKNLTHAHAWLGLIISGVLMIVFVCGSISFFRHNITQWDSQYHAPAAASGEVVPVSTILDNIAAQNFAIPAHHNLLIALPSAEQPYYYTAFETETADGHHVDHQLNFDAVTGQQLPFDLDTFYLSDMLYNLHISLLLPYGTEIVGVITLLFFVMVMSGLCMVLKKMISHFYQYRTNRNKDTYLDGHTLIGVSSLPFTFVFALTGVMFNLSIVLQAGFGFAVFKGDIPALIQTAGFFQFPQVEYSGNAVNNSQVDVILKKTQTQYPNQAIKIINIYGAGDENGEVEVRLHEQNSLVPTTYLTYKLKDASFIDEYNSKQAPTAATYTALSNLHFGEFGGITLKFVYFILGFSCCYLILSGNLIWLEKRENNRQQSKRGLAFVKAMTLALSTGTLIAVACSFIGARLTPISWDRTELLPTLFFCAIGVSLLHAIFNSMQRQRVRLAMVQQLFVAALLFTICPIYDLINTIFGHTTHSYQLLDVVLVNAMLLVVAGFCFTLAQYKRRGLVKNSPFDDTPKPILE
ncbi:PepSY domain-containing protein [Pseudoalteromonas sp. NEC-BIFX-2020_015]|uniref:PepSY-associated TM helix domain-containing protein n=1 Tax=Pseudoalteromonas sp. NEC-BIFX-2020_015 TaxID=2729544 RepID=UPI0014617069|nr:PepSY-associated TM helix domain-containing protein [Pseudoalteromonas sp. NEC-BIFX-2020_015]NMR24729.1 PepSY domain-containing protein [Pseudoalteromonas sp. NEC-BIFX-2020_015]